MRLQVQLGFGNGVVDDIFFVPGYNVRGFVVAQVYSFCRNQSHVNAVSFS